jgi:hypothetical protein
VTSLLMRPSLKFDHGIVARASRSSEPRGHSYKHTALMRMHSAAVNTHASRHHTNSSLILQPIIRFTIQKAISAFYGDLTGILYTKHVTKAGVL